jgi:hypothetical protein
MPVNGKRAQIVRLHRYQPRSLRAAHDAVLKDASEKIGKDGDDIEAHAFPMITARAL